MTNSAASGDGQGEKMRAAVLAKAGGGWERGASKCQYRRPRSPLGSARATLFVRILAALRGLSPLSLALLQYPTPYSLPGAGNSRLPDRDGFMVGRPLMAALGRFRLLYLASNAPDVAAAMRAAAEAEGFAHREPGGQLSVRAISGGGGRETERGRRARKEQKQRVGRGRREAVDEGGA